MRTPPFYAFTDALPIERHIPIPSEASKVRTRPEANPLRSLRELQSGESLLVRLNIFAAHILQTLTTEQKRLKALEQRIASYRSMLRREDRKTQKPLRKYCTRAEFAEDGRVLGVRVWRTE